MNTQILTIYTNPFLHTMEWRMANDEDRAVMLNAWIYEQTNVLPNRSQELFNFLANGGTIARYGGDFEKASGEVVKMDRWLKTLIRVGLVKIARRGSWQYIDIIETFKESVTWWAA